MIVIMTIISITINNKNDNDNDNNDNNLHACPRGLRGLEGPLRLG